MKKLLAILALSLALGTIAPLPALAAEAPADGSYAIEVELEGGSGKSTVESPAMLEVEAGEMTATIVWSSSNYDLMVVDGTEYQPVTLDGGSTFEIPVATLDEALPISAETTAMGSPHMIDYTLTFDSASLQETSETPAADQSADKSATESASEESTPADNLPLIIGGAVVVVVIVVVVAVALRRKGSR